MQEGRDPAQQRVGEHVAQALGHLGPQAASLGAGPRLLSPPDPGQARRGAEEADRVEADDQRGGQNAQQPAGHGGAGDLGNGLAGLQAGVAGDELVRSTRWGR